jgi:hypothetical protein
MPHRCGRRRGVSGVRPFVRDDLDAVARLHAGEGEDGSLADRTSRFAAFFARTILDQPEADPTIPSLVYEEGGEVLGFLGSNVRRLTFDGRRAAMGCSAHLLAHPSVRHKAVGARLLATYLEGPQALTITDGANEVVRRMWEGFGGQTVHVGCLTFARVLRPFALTTHRAASKRELPTLERVVSPVARVLDATATAVVARKGSTTLESVRLTPELLLQHFDEVTAHLRLVPHYDRESLTWLLRELEQVGVEQVFPNRVPRGPVFAELVKGDQGVVGWYVCQLRRGGFCRVLQLAAKPRRAGDVLDHLWARAFEEGAAGVYGRLEPHLVGPLSERRLLLRFSQGRFLVHGRDQEVVDAVLRGEALLTRLEGEWW